MHTVNLRVVMHIYINRKSSFPQQVTVNKHRAATAGKALGPGPGPCLDYGFHYAFIRNNRSKKFGVEYLECSTWLHLCPPTFFAYFWQSTDIYGFLLVFSAISMEKGCKNHRINLYSSNVKTNGILVGKPCNIYRLQGKSYDTNRITLLSVNITGIPYNIYTIFPIECDSYCPSP